MTTARRIYQATRRGGHRVHFLGRFAWWNNVGRHLGLRDNWLRTREYRYYYCGLWCFLTDQRFCKGITDAED